MHLVTRFLAASQSSEPPPSSFQMDLAGTASSNANTQSTADETKYDIIEDCRCTTTDG